MRPLNCRSCGYSLLFAGVISSTSLPAFAGDNHFVTIHGGDVHFADVQIFIESDTAAHAYLAVELTRLDRESGHAIVDATDVSVGLARRNGEWVVTTAESKADPKVH